MLPSHGLLTLPSENFGLTTNNQRECNVKSKIFLLILAIGTQLPLLAQQPTVPEGPTATTSYTEAQLRQLVPPALPEDVSSPEAIVKAMHEAVSGPQGQWNPDRLRSLCVPNVFFESEDNDKNGTLSIATITLDQLVKDFQNLHQAIPWHEAVSNFSVTRIDRKDGTILAVVSYSGSDNPDKDHPMPSTLTSTSTLLFFAKRWWIVNHTW